jgi:hypothetical protein
VAAIPRGSANRSVAEIIRRQDQPRKQGPAASQLATGVLRSTGFGDWHYVAYLDQRTMLLARNVASADRERRIGTIPWITRNPGNITVSQKPEKEVGPGPKEAFKRGAYGKGGSTQLDPDTLRYAVFPSVAEGLAAIWPQLVVLNASNGGKLTLLGAMKIFKGVERSETAAVRDSYVAEIADLMTDIILEHGDTEEGAQAGEGPARAEARREALAILNTPMSQLDAGDVRYEIARDALVQKEGGLNAPGVTFRCDEGFLPNSRGRYSAAQWSAIEALKASASVTAELRGLLACA